MKRVVFRGHFVPVRALSDRRLAVADYAKSPNICVLQHTSLDTKRMLLHLVNGCIVLGRIRMGSIRVGLGSVLMAISRRPIVQRFKPRDSFSFLVCVCAV
jgi:hypothetical protein